jgi:hypothetical protein
VPQHIVVAPDGAKIIVNAPEGASIDDIMAYAKANYVPGQGAPRAQNTAVTAPVAAPSLVSPAPAAPSDFWSNIGHALTGMVPQIPAVQSIAKAASNAVSPINQRVSQAFEHLGNDLGAAAAFQFGGSPKANVSVGGGVGRAVSALNPLNLVSLGAGLVIDPAGTAKDFAGAMDPRPIFDPSVDIGTRAEHAANLALLATALPHIFGKLRAEAPGGTLAPTQAHPAQAPPALTDSVVQKPPIQSHGAAPPVLTESVPVLPELRPTVTPEPAPQAPDIVGAKKVSPSPIQEPHPPETIPEPRDVYGMARQIQDPIREARGEAPTKTVPTRTKAQIESAGSAMYDQLGPDGMRQKISQSLESGLPLSVDETAASAKYGRELKNTATSLEDQLRSRPDDPALVFQYDGIVKDLDSIEQAAQIVRNKGFYEHGQALQVAYAPDYSQVSLLSRARGENGGAPLEKADIMALQDHAAQIKTKDLEIASLRQSLEDSFKTFAQKRPVAKEGKPVQEPPVLSDSVAQKRPVSQKRGTPEYRISQLRRLAGVDKGMPDGLAMASKRTGAISGPDSDARLYDVHVRALAREYVKQGASSMADLEKAFANDPRLKNAAGEPIVSPDMVRSAIAPQYRIALTKRAAATIEADKVLRGIRAKAEFRRLGPLQKVAHTALDLTNGLARSAMFAFDTSEIGRSGLKVAISHPAEFMKALKGNIGAIRDASVTDQIARMRQDPQYDKLIRAGLAINDMKGGVHEEYFSSKVMHALDNLTPLKPYQRGEASFTAMRNAQRFELAKKFDRMVPDSNPLKDAYLKDIAAAVNTFTGKPSTELGKMFASKASQIFSTPGYVVSKYEYALGSPIVGAKSPIGKTVIARELYVKPLAAYAVAVTALATIGKQNGVVKKVDLDPRSTDFGRAEFAGGHIVNIFAQDAGPIRAIARVIAGSITRSGRYMPGPSISDLPPRAPVVKMLEDAKNGVYDEETGKKRAMRPSDVLDSFLPLTAKEVVKTAKDNPAEAILPALGISTQKGHLNTKKVPSILW